MENGLEEGRLILEGRSRPTLENAQFTLNILRREHPRVSAVANVSSDYHITRGCLLFERTMLMGAAEQQEPQIHVISNCASPLRTRIIRRIICADGRCTTCCN